jgi:FtsH-binding integral membrane protein
VSLSTLRVVIGFLVSPAVPALGLYLINLCFVSRQEALLAGGILATLGYAAAVVVGMPAYLIMRKRSAASLRAYLMVGGLIGLLFYFLFFGVWGLVSYQSAPAHAIALMRNSGAAGLTAIGYASIASGIFWLIAIRNNVIFA